MHEGYELCTDKEDGKGGEMTRRLIKIVGLVVMGALLATLPALVSCGEEGGAEGVELIIGFQSDFTGPVCSATAVVYDAFVDYLNTAKEEDLLGGLRPKVMTYDTRTDYARYPIAYKWLVGQGVKLILCPSATDIEMNLRKYDEDKITGFTTTGLESLRAQEWAFALFPTHEAQAAGVLKSIVDTWDYQGKGRNPRVGQVGFLGMLPTTAMKAGFDQFMAANPGKIDWMGLQAAPMGASTWTAEVLALIDCDYVVLSTYGVNTGNVVKEARARGYQGNFHSTSMSLGGYFDLVRDVVPPSELYGCYLVHQMPWFTECTFTEEWQEALLRYHPGAYAELEIGKGGYGSGWAWGIWLVDIMRRAAEKVGAENVDGAAIRDAAMSSNLDLTAEGWGNPWTVREGNHIVIRTSRTYQWSVQKETWDPIDDWFDMSLD